MSIPFEVVPQMPQLKRRRSNSTELDSVVLNLLKGEVVALQVEDKSEMMRLGSRLRQAVKQQGFRIKQVHMPEEKKVYFQRVTGKDGA